MAALKRLLDAADEAEDVVEVLAQNRRTDGRREWSSVGAWLQPGQSIAILSADDPQTTQAAPTRSQKLADAGYVRRPTLHALEMRTALELIAAQRRADGTWNLDRAACRRLAAEALGQYDDDEPTAGTGALAVPRVPPRLFPDGDDD